MNIFHSHNRYDQTFDLKAVISHSDLISWFSGFGLYLLSRKIHVNKMLFEDTIIDPKINMGHCVLYFIVQ